MSVDSCSVSVVIPVKNAEAYLPELLPRLLDQEPPPGEILLLDSMSTDRTREIAAEFPRVRVVPVELFSHGGTRNLGVLEARGDLVALMTQDARPLDRDWLAKLAAPFADPKVAYAFSRQVPYPAAPPMERYFLSVRFPAEGRRYEAPGGRVESLEQLFCSNVASMLRREAALAHPFDDGLIMAEDQQLSRDLQEAGYAVVYVPESVVEHSHRYSPAQTFRRYFDSVVALRQLFPERELSDNASLGIKYLAGEARFLLRRHPLALPRFGMTLGAKALATLLAHRHERLPRRFRRRCSMHRGYWE